MEVVSPIQVYVFDGLCLDATRRLLHRDGEAISLNPKAFDVLLLLVENHDRVLSKDEILSTVWAGQFVEESNLAVQISTLRKILGEKKDSHRFIVTVPGKGYRFVARVNDFESIPKPEEPITADNLPPVQQRAEKDPQLFSEFSKRRLTAIVLLSGFALFLISTIYIFRSSGVENSKPLKLARITTGGKVTVAAITPNGQYCVFAQAEPDGESLWLRQMATGTQTRILVPANLEYVGLAVSPDNNFIYYSVFLGNQAGGYLRRISLVGGPESEIAGVETGVAVSFSPDGRHFAYTVGSSSRGASYLKSSNLEGSETITLSTAKNEDRSFESFKSKPVAWSPDGNNIAAALSVEKEGERRAGILLVSPEGKAERFLVSPKFAFVDDLTWLDSDTLAFVGYETDEELGQIFTVKQSTSEIRKLTNDLDSYSWIGHANGSLIAVKLSSVSALKIVSADSAETEVTARELLSESGKVWTYFGPDNAVYFTSAESGKREIWRFNEGDASRKQITNDAQVTYGFAVSPVDGSVIFCSNRNGRHSLWFSDAHGRNLRQLTDQDDIAPQFSANGKLVVFQRGMSSRATVWGLRIDSGEIFQISHGYSLKPTASNDGSIVAYYMMDYEDQGVWKIALASSSSGTVENKLSFPATVNERRMVWHPTIPVISQAYHNGADASLLLMHIDRSPPKEIRNLGKGRINSFAWSRDGSKIVYSMLNQTRDIVSLSDF